MALCLDLSPVLIVARQVVAFPHPGYFCILLKEILGQTRDKCYLKFGILDICHTSTNCVYGPRHVWTAFYNDLCSC